MFKEVKPDLLIPNNLDENVQELGDQLKVNENYEQEIDGLHVIVSYHAPTSSFIGFIENTTNKIISNIRIEIYLSNAVELGPTRPGSLQPGEMKNISLLVHNQGFSEWSVVVEFEL